MPSAEPSAESYMGLDLTILRSWPEPKPRVWRLTEWSTQAPLLFLFLGARDYRLG